jgi:hypothetical protein
MVISIFYKTLILIDNWPETNPAKRQKPVVPGKKQKINTPIG